MTEKLPKSTGKGARALDSDFVFSKFTEDDARNALQTGNILEYTNWYSQEMNALGKHPSDSQKAALLMRAADIYARAGEPEGAIAQLRNAMKLDPAQRERIRDMMNTVDPERRFHGN